MLANFVCIFRFSFFSFLCVCVFVITAYESGGYE